LSGTHQSESVPVRKDFFCKIQTSKHVRQTSSHDAVILLTAKDRPACPSHIVFF